MAVDRTAHNRRQGQSCAFAFFGRKEKARRSPRQGRKSSPNVNHLLNALIRLSRETFRAGRVGMHDSFLRCAHDGNVTLPRIGDFRANLALRSEN
jgi:hypothetical protein